MTVIGIFFGIMPIHPLNKPIAIHEMTCQTVQIPIPSNILDKNVVNIANIIAATGPRNKPQIITIEVTGCTLGRNAKAYLPTTASAASNANNVSL